MLLHVISTDTVIVQLIALGNTVTFIDGFVEPWTAASGVL